MKRTPLARGSSQLKRTPMRRRARRPRPAGDVDRAYMAWLRRQCCCICGRNPPCHAHHPRTGAGLAQKSPDAGCVSLCLVCHHDLHGLCGRFRGWDRDRLATWEAARGAELRAMYAAERAA